MIRAKHHPLYVRASDWIMERLLHRHFRQIHIRSQVKDPEGPVLLLANHFSWWDGFLARYAVTKTLKKKVFVMMLEEELSKRPVLRKVGAFSVRKNSRTVKESMDYAIKILESPDHLLLLFPQGKFQSLHQYPLEFEKGWFRILEEAPGNTKVVFLAALTDYFDHRRPDLTIYLDQANRYNSGGRDSGLTDTAPEKTAKHSETATFRSPEEATSAYNEFLKKAIEQQNRKANQ